MNMEQSSKWEINRKDAAKWFRNASIFLAPVIVIYLGFVADNLRDGINWADFVPTAAVQGMIMLYAVNTVLDFFRKLIAGPKPN